MSANSALLEAESHNVRRIPLFRWLVEQWSGFVDRRHSPKSDPRASHENTNEVPGEFEFYTPLPSRVP